MNRRKFLKILGIGALAVPTAIFGYSLLSKPKDLEEFVKFPDSIPGAEKVEKFPVEGARYCLAHIRQIHHVEYDPNDSIDRRLKVHLPTKKELDRINSHQKNIYEILDYLKQKGVTNSVYLEGIDESMLNRIKKIKMIPEDDELVRAVIDLEEKAKQKIIWNVPEGYTPERVVQETMQKIESLKKRLAEHDEKYKYFYGGGLRLVLDGKIEPRYEDLALSDKAYNEIIKTRKPGMAVFDDREDSILRSIANGNESLGVVEFGGAHAWGGKESCGESYSLDGRKSFKDNIAEWNKEHPDRKFCLIEVVPYGYVKGGGRK